MPKNKSNIHAGHRIRVRKEILTRGIDENMPPHKVLEFLLFYCVVQGDTNPLAHELIDKFGTLYGVLDAPIEELTSFKGIKENGAALLKSLVPVTRYCMAERIRNINCFSNLDLIANYFEAMHYGLESEKISVMYFDSKARLLKWETVASGDIDSVGVPKKLIISHALNLKATSVAIAHNHPNGFALPSNADIDATIALKEALKSVDIYLIDHVICSKTDTVSMAQSDTYKDIFPPKNYL